MKIITANKQFAMPLLVALPEVLQHFIYTFIYDEVKIHYWLKKYNIKKTLHELRNSYNGEFYGVLTHIDRYCMNATQPTMCDKMVMYNEYGVWRDRTKFRDGLGNLIKVVYTWEDENCDYNQMFYNFPKMLHTQQKIRHDMLGLYKYLAWIIVSYDDEFV